MSDELLTADEAAAYLSKSRQAFYAWRRRHDIPSVGIGRGLRFRRADLVREGGDAPVKVEVKVDMRELARQFARGGADVH